MSASKLLTRSGRGIFPALALSLPTILSFLLLVGTTPALGDLTAEEIEGTYVLQVGVAEKCAKELVFVAGSSDLTIEASEIKLGDNQCTGDGKISLAESPANSIATRYLKDKGNDTGVFYAGSVSGAGDSGITCGESGGEQSSLEAGEELIIVKSNVEMVVKTNELFGLSTTSIGEAAEEFSFTVGNRFVVVGMRCVYVESGVDESDNVCFPAHARLAIVPHSSSSIGSSSNSNSDSDNDSDRRTTMTMQQLSVGDHVATDGAGTVEPVLGFSHRNARERARFVTVHTAMGTLTATPGHFVHVVKPSHRSQFECASGCATIPGTATMEMIGLVKPGWRLVHMSGALPVVTKVSYAVHTGVWNPHTKSGSIMVDGFMASCYTKAVDAMAAHALLTPLRAEAVRRVTRLGWDLLTSRCAAFQSRLY